MLAATFAGSSVASISTQRSRFVGRDLPIRVAQLLVKADVFRFEPVGGAAAAPGGGALETDFHRHVQDHGEVRFQVADRDPLHRIEKLLRHMPERALIDPRRIRKAVAEHPCALLERGLDHGARMVIARGGKQQRFRFGAEQLAHPGEDQMADDFRAGRSAGLAGDDGVQFHAGQPLGQDLDLGGFAGPFTAFKGDETSRALPRLVDRCVGHRHSFSAPARNSPIASSATPSTARRIVEPRPTASAA